MRRFAIFIRLYRTKRTAKHWQLVDEVVTASDKTTAAANAAKRFPNYFVKVKEIIPVEDLDELDTLGKVVIRYAATI